MNLLRTVSTVSGLTLLSRITGLARESLKATVFGAGLQMDAFEAAFRLPNILRRLFARVRSRRASFPSSPNIAASEARMPRGERVGRVGSLLALILLGVTIAAC